MLFYWSSNNREGQAGLAAFEKVLQQAGWTDGVNVRFDVRWSEENAERIRKNAAELLALTPDVILANATPSVTTLQTLTTTMPIVFVTGVRSGGSRYYRFARPGGNITGFMNFEYSLSGKWLELLRQVVPSCPGRRASRSTSIRLPIIGQFSAIPGRRTAACDRADGRQCQ